MNDRDIKIELRDVCHIAIEEYVKSIRGANLFRQAQIKVTGNSTLEMRYKDEFHKSHFVTIQLTKHKE